MFGSPTFQRGVWDQTNISKKQTKEDQFAWSSEELTGVEIVNQVLYIVKWNIG